MWGDYERMIKIYNGDLLKSDCNYICHQVNCQGKMNSGVAKTIRTRWPLVYEEYANFYQYYVDKALKMDCSGFGPDASELMLGLVQRVQVEKDKTIVNMFAQQYYGYDGRRYTSYDAFWNCLHLIKEKVPKGSKIGFPYGIGCVRGGANWHIIYEMVNEVLGADYEVEIWRLDVE